MAPPTGAVRRAGSGPRRALTFWRRSTQLRVLVSTLVLSALVVSAVSWFLLRQTRDGLLDHRVDAVVAEAGSETRDAEALLAGASPGDVDVDKQVRDLADPIIARGLTRGFDVVLTGPVDPAPGATEVPSSPQVSLSTAGLDVARSVPAALIETMTQPGAAPSWTYTRVVDADGARPGVAVASSVRLPADGRTYVLYLLFGLDEEQETLGLVQRALLTASVLLLVLVAGLTWLVTRQVVTPVRMARQVAERLAAGRLQERLRVRGEDDLARLATSFNQMASNLQRQIRQLEELSRVQRRFVSDVSHELRTPLTTVRMASDVLHDARADFDPGAARAAELLQHELDRFETLLTDLLEISRFDAGAAVLETSEINLGDVVRRVVAGTAVLAEQRGVRVEIVDATAPAPADPAGPADLAPGGAAAEVSPDDGPSGRACLAEADERRIERVVRNLVSNAIDHADPTREGPGVVITLGADDAASAITVRDFGVGLEAGESAMVFNRFWRADPARARTSGGTGLGLSIALEDAHLHGGWLQAWGRPGRGAQFRLTLPRRTGGTLRRSPLPLEPRDAASPGSPGSPESPASAGSGAAR
ncbi:ATP-binding protein [Nocardioides sp.]|uniref:ATP-binding protein n=1 Tax=Nocardioides sp. TaxID=35761 RepID=UPI0035194C6F